VELAGTRCAPRGTEGTARCRGQWTTMSTMVATMSVSVLCSRTAGCPSCWSPAGHPARLKHTNQKWLSVGCVFAWKAYQTLDIEWTLQMMAKLRYDFQEQSYPICVPNMVPILRRWQCGRQMCILPHLFASLGRAPGPSTKRPHRPLHRPITRHRRTMAAAGDSIKQHAGPPRTPSAWPIPPAPPLRATAAALEPSLPLPPSTALALWRLIPLSRPWTRRSCWTRTTPPPPPRTRAVGGRGHHDAALQALGLGPPPPRPRLVLTKLGEIRKFQKIRTGIHHKFE
jgi:hypothetical protein